MYLCESWSKTLRSEVKVSLKFSRYALLIKKMPKQFQNFKISLSLIKNQLGYPASPMVDKNLWYFPAFYSLMHKTVCNYDSSFIFCAFHFIIFFRVFSLHLKRIAISFTLVWRMESSFTFRNLFVKYILRKAKIGLPRSHAT